MGGRNTLILNDNYYKSIQNKRYKDEESATEIEGKGIACYWLKRLLNERKMEHERIEPGIFPVQTSRHICYIVELFDKNKFYMNICS